MGTAVDGESVDAARHDYLTGRRKAAILLVLLGSEQATEIFKHLDEDEIEQLSFEIARLDGIGPEDQERALAEFQELMLARDVAPSGGMDYARGLLEKSLGAEQAVAMISRLSRSLRSRPFGFVRRTDPAQLLSFIRDEHPQTIALVLAYLNPKDAAVLLTNLPYSMQADVSRRIATLDRTAPAIVQEVERVLQHKLTGPAAAPAGAGYAASGGIGTVMRILHHLDRSTEQAIIDALEQEDPRLAQEIKQHLFVFEDLLLLDDEAMQVVLREVDRQGLAAALKAVDTEILDRVLRNMSKRAAALLQEAMEHLGPIRLGQVEEAQQRVATIIRQLHQRGEIVVRPDATRDQAPPPKA